MDNLGVAMNATTLEAYALSKGIKGTWNSMDNATKNTLAMEMFLEKTSYAAGNYAKENETLAGSLTTAKAAMTNFLSGAGDTKSLVDSFKNATNVIIKNLKDILPRLSTGVTEIINGLAPLIPVLMQQLIPPILDGAVKLVSGIVASFPATALIIVTALKDSLIANIPALAPAITGFSDLFKNIGNAISESGIIQNVVSLFDAIVNSIGVVNVPVKSFFDLFGDALSKSITGISNSISFLAENFNTIIAVLIPLTTAFVAWRSAIAISVLIEAFTASLGGLTIAQKLSAVAQGILNTTMLANPFVAVTVAIGALVGGFIALYKNNEQFRSSANDAFLEIKAVVMPIIEKLKELFLQLAESLKPIIDDSLPVLKNVFSLIFESIKNIVLVAVEYIAMQVKIIVTVFSGIIDFMSNVFAGNWSGAWDSIKQTVITVFQYIQDFLGDFPEKMLEVGKNIVAGIGRGIQAGASKVKEEVSNFANGLLQSAKDALGIKSPSKKAEEEIGKEFIAGTSVGIIKNKDGAISEAKKLSEEILEASKIPDFAPNVEPQTIIKSLTENDSFDSGKSVGNNFVDGIKQAFLEAEAGQIEILVTNFEKVKSTTSVKLTEVSATAIDIYKKMVSQIDLFLRIEGQNLGKVFAQTFGDALISEQQNLYQKALGVAVAIKDAFQATLSDTGSNGGSNTGSIFSAVEGFTIDTSTSQQPETPVVNQYFYGVKEEKTAFETYRATQKALSTEFI